MANSMFLSQIAILTDAASNYAGEVIRSNDTLKSS